MHAFMRANIRRFIKASQVLSDLALHYESVLRTTAAITSQHFLKCPQIRMNATFERGRASVSYECNIPSHFVNVFQGPFTFGVLLHPAPGVISSCNEHSPIRRGAECTPRRSGKAALARHYANGQDIHPIWVWGVRGQCRPSR